MPEQGYLEQLKNLGLPGWLVIAAAAIFIIKQVGLDQPILSAISSVFSFFKERVKAKEEYQRKHLTSREKSKQIGELKQSYLESWLPEQFTTNQSETLAQLGAYQDFLMKETSKKLDITIELGQKTSELKAGQESIKQAVEHFSVRLSEVWENFERLFAEIDIINRHLEDIDKNIEAIKHDTSNR